MKCPVCAKKTCKCSEDWKAANRPADQYPGYITAEQLLLRQRAEMARKLAELRVGKRITTKEDVDEKLAEIAAHEWSEVG